MVDSAAPYGTRNAGRVVQRSWGGDGIILKRPRGEGKLNTCPSPGDIMVLRQRVMPEGETVATYTGVARA